ncbi:hypothetical protein [Brevibacillus sp. SIMBA_040]|uniref:hypothetical protein n=1 Tax=unclassified Brevibacillus TaxID=2684853 RepID=UPI00397E6FDA
MTVANWLGVYGLLMDIVGTYFLISGFFGKKYETMLREMQSAFDYNKEAFINVADQKASALTGFRILILGFILQIVGNLPITELLNIQLVASIGFLLCFSLVFILIMYKRTLTNFYIGLLSINWEYPSKLEELPQVLQQLIEKSGTPGYNSAVMIEKKSKLNIRLFLAVASLGEESSKHN